MVTRERRTPACVVSVLHTYDIDKTRLRNLSITRFWFQSKYTYYKVEL